MYVSSTVCLLCVTSITQGLSEDVSISKFFDDPMLLELARQDVMLLNLIYIIYMTLYMYMYIVHVIILQASCISDSNAYAHIENVACVREGKLSMCLKAEQYVWYTINRAKKNSIAINTKLRRINFITQVSKACKVTLAHLSPESNVRL